MKSLIFDSRPNVEKILETYTYGRFVLARTSDEVISTLRSIGKTITEIVIFDSVPSDELTQVEHVLSEFFPALSHVYEHNGSSTSSNHKEGFPQISPSTLS